MPESRVTAARPALEPWLRCRGSFKAAHTLEARLSSEPWWWKSKVVADRERVILEKIGSQGFGTSEAGQVSGACCPGKAFIRNVYANDAPKGDETFWEVKDCGSGVTSKELQAPLAAPRFPDTAKISRNIAREGASKSWSRGLGFKFSKACRNKTTR